MRRPTHMVGPFCALTLAGCAAGLADEPPDVEEVEQAIEEVVVEAPRERGFQREELNLDSGGGGSLGSLSGGGGGGRRPGPDPKDAEECRTTVYEPCRERARTAYESCTSVYRDPSEDVDPEVVLPEIQEQICAEQNVTQQAQCDTDYQNCVRSK